MTEKAAKSIRQWAIAAVWLFIAYIVLSFILVPVLPLVVYCLFVGTIIFLLGKIIFGKNEV